MIAIINTGGANISSIVNAFETLGMDIVLTSDQKKISQATHVILPGVGAAKACMDYLSSLGLKDFIPTLNRPVLGICLGMQILFDHSEEGDVPCMGIIKGQIKKLTKIPGMSIPHMGWNAVEYVQSENPLLKGIPEGSCFYYANSFYAPKGIYSVGISHYSDNISAIVQKNNFFGVQFHPERSGLTGLQLLRNFCGLEL